MRIYSLVVLMMLGCARSSMSLPRETYIAIKIAGVGGYDWCDGINPIVWQDVNWALLDVVGHGIPIVPVQDMEVALSGPALTLENFWNKSISAYWRSMIPPDAAIRVVALPALNGGMNGGMSYGVCKPRGGWVSVHLSGDYFKDKLTTLHELGHALGASDLHPGQTCPPGCNPKPFETLPCCTPTPPSIMDADAGDRCRSNYLACGFSAISKRQIKRCLVLRRR
jgi:hypothetical protein